MSLRTKTREQLYQQHRYRLGRVEQSALRGYLQTIEKVQGQGVRVPDLTLALFAAKTSTYSAAIASAPGRLYFVWAISNTGSTLDTIVALNDNSVAIAAFKAKSLKATEAYFYGHDEGIGLPFTTDLKVAAFAAAGGIETPANPAAADRPDIVVCYGINTVNTDDANLINTNYG